MSRVIDNQDTNEMYRYYEARIEALKRENARLKHELAESEEVLNAMRDYVVRTVVSQEGQ